MQQADRSRILKILGIDVWVTRSGSVAAPESAVGSGQGIRPAVPAAEDLSVLSRQLRGDLKQATPRPAAAVPAQTAGANPLDAGRRTMVTGSDLRRTQVLSLRGSKVLVLLETQDLKYARRLASDLVLAGEGDWQSRLEQTVFDWHPQQVGSAGVSGQRALAAFVDKQLDDLGGDRGVIVCQRVLDLLPELVDAITRRNHHYVALPALRELALDGEAKRTLWRKIQQLKVR